MYSLTRSFGDFFHVRTHLVLTSCGTLGHKTPFQVRLLRKPTLSQRCACGKFIGSVGHWTGPSEKCRLSKASVDPTGAQTWPEWRQKVWPFLLWPVVGYGRPLGWGHDLWPGTLFSWGILESCQHLQLLREHAWAWKMRPGRSSCHLCTHLGPALAL